MYIYISINIYIRSFRHNNRTKGLNSLKDTLHIWELGNIKTYKNKII